MLQEKDYLLRQIKQLVDAFKKQEELSREQFQLTADSDLGELFEEITGISKELFREGRLIPIMGMLRMMDAPNQLVLVGANRLLPRWHFQCSRDHWRCLCEGDSQ